MFNYKFNICFHFFNKKNFLNKICIKILNKIGINIMLYLNYLKLTLWKFLKKL